MKASSASPVRPRVARNAAWRWRAECTPAAASWRWLGRASVRSSSRLGNALDLLQVGRGLVGLAQQGPDLVAVAGELGRGTDVDVGGCRAVEVDGHDVADATG